MKINNWTAIVLPERATPVEEFAASELQKYIRQISGRLIPLRYDRDSGADESVILLGGPQRNRHTLRYVSQREFAEYVPGPEGFMIKTFGPALILAGCGSNQTEEARATLYAVYEFLERYLGCAFIAYGKPGSGMGEYIPASYSPIAENIEYIKTKADLLYRGTIVQFDGNNMLNSDASHGLTLPLVDWMAKNRLNRIHLTMDSYEKFKASGIVDEIDKRGIAIRVGHHDSGTFFLPPQGNEYFPEKYFDTHPDFYKMQKDGSRFFPETKWSGQLVYDMRNQACIEQFAENMKQWIRANPLVDIIDIWPNDAIEAQCACKLCKKHSKIENYVWFVSEIARLVRADYPHIKVCMIVYGDLRKPPQNIKLDEGILVEVSTWGGEYDPTHWAFGHILRPFGKKDGSGLIGTPVEENAIKWSHIAEGLIYYDYYMTNFGSRQVYCPMADEICAIYENFAKTKYCHGTGTQMEAYNLWNYLFNFYTHGRKAYDVSLTLEDLLERFTRIFGKGGEYIKQYIQYIESFYEGQESDGEKSAAWFISNVDSKKVYALFEKAYDAETELRDNIRLLRMAFRYSDLHINSPECAELKYMSKTFGSYWGAKGQTGYGLAVVDKPNDTDFTPDKWYQTDVKRGEI